MDDELRDLTPRERLWLDSLPIEEYPVGLHAIDLEGSTMATAHNAIMQWKTERRLEKVEEDLAELARRGPVKDLMKLAGAISGSAITGVLAVLGTQHGRPI